MSIYFVSTYIGPLKLLDISNNFKKVEGAKYFFFTNLKKKDIINNCWEIIEINLNDFKNINNFVKISRYFKFNIINYFNNKLKLNPEFIFYCDSYLYPKVSVDWTIICYFLKNNKTGIIQYNHHRSNGGIETDLQHIYIGKKDSESNMNKTKEFLMNIDNNINLKTPQYFENTVIGYYVNNNNTIKQCNDFWNYYIDCPTYRDQPLWNFIYLKNNFIPYIDNNFRDYFDGIKKIERNINEYNSANNIL
jgi:hypothetical protein